MSLIPPNPVGVVPGSGLWNDWIEKIRSAVNSTLQGFDFSLITGKPTTLSGYGITDAQPIAARDAANGYAGLNASTRVDKGVDTTDDVIVDSTTRGVVLKSPNLHYWRVSISNAGVLTWTDLGLTKP